MFCIEAACSSVVNEETDVLSGLIDAVLTDRRLNRLVYPDRTSFR